MAVNLSPVGGVAAQFFDNAGNVLTGGKLYTYLAGTTTPAVAYTTSAGNVAWSNPIILDAAGRVSGSGEIWLTDGTQYKFILRDSNDVLIATYDNVIGINSNFVNFTNEQEIQTATAGQTVFNLTTTQYSPGTNNLSVFVDGVNQYGPGAQYAYLETDQDTITFVNGLHVGALVKFTTSQLNSSAGQNAFQVSYVPPFTNSVATNVGDKLSQYVSVIDFGAVADSVTDNVPYFEAARDSGEAIYVPSGTYNFDSAFSSNGSAAWMIAPNVQFVGTQPDFERGVWSDYTPSGIPGGDGVNLWRLYDRVLIGDANTGYNGEFNQGTTWTSNYGIGYFQVFSQTASFSSFGGLGIAAASQSIDVPAANDGTIAVAASAINNNPSAKSAWSYYGQSVQTAASGGTFTSGMELNTCSEKVSDDPSPYNIVSGITLPHTHWVGVGGEFPQLISSDCKPISCGMIFASNAYRNAVAGTGNLFRRGIVFQADAILGTNGVTGKGIAMSFAKGHSLEWDFLSSGFTYRGARIRSDVLSISNPTGLVFNNDGVNFMSLDASPIVATEKVLVKIPAISTAVNNLSLSASPTGTALNIAAEGTDTNIDMAITPKGSGVLRYNVAVSGITTETVTGFMLIKDSGGTLRKVAIVS
jgi:hypothetical protein